MPEDFQALAAQSADMSTVATADGVYRYVSPASRRLFGWDPDELEGHREEEFVHPDDLPPLRAAEESAHAPEVVFVTSFRFRRKDGSYRWAEATSRRVEGGGSTFVVSTVRDITERQKSDLALQRRATTDPLTGVANRAVLMDRLGQAIRRQDRGRGVLAVLYLDLDRFKVINDSLGHRVGDRVLSALAQRVLGFVRASDTLARVGGDEFVLLAEDVVDEQAVVALGNRIVQAGRKPFLVGDQEFVCTTSVGIAIGSDSHRTPESLLHEADLAMFRAKDRGRDRAEVFDEDLRTRAVGRLATERMLRRALDEQRLRVEYQPIIDLRTGRATSAEALVRIVDPDVGLLQPDSFLEVAEETGLLLTMDERVFAEAVRQAAAWRARFAGSGFSGVSVNITSGHLADAGFAKSVVDALDEHDLPHDHLQVELTERVLMEASDSAITGLRALRDAGVPVGLDDFGTGFSSLAYLRQFPLDFVKIDRSFLGGAAAAVDNDAIVAAIVGLSHALGLAVVAEGVETQRQLESLVSLECDRAQGFLLARPGPPEAVDELVRSGPAVTG